MDTKERKTPVQDSRRPAPCSVRRTQAGAGAATAAKIELEEPDSISRASPKKFLARSSLVGFF
jgi:hypothetical protein